MWGILKILAFVIPLMIGFSETIMIPFKDDTTVYLYYDIDKVILPFYQEPGFYFDKISLSPDGKLIAAIAISKKFFSDKNGYPYQKHKLVLLNLKSEIIMVIPDVQVFSWSPDSSKLAYIAGIDYEGFAFTPSGLWILDVKSKDIRKLDPIGGYDIYWASFDNHIYATDFRLVYKYDPKTGEKTETTYKGIYFSPDGKFYFKKGYEGKSSLHLTTTNEDITLTFDFSRKIAESYDIKWAPNGEMFLLLGGDLACRVWQVKTKKLIMEIPKVENAWWQQDSSGIFVQKFHRPQIIKHSIP